MLKFIYLNEIFFKEDIAIDLLELADKYSISELKKQCAEGLLNKITVHNAGRIIQVAKRAEMEELEQATINYLKTNFVKFIKNLSPDENPIDFFSQTYEP